MVDIKKINQINALIFTPKKAPLFPAKGGIPPLRNKAGMKRKIENLLQESPVLLERGVGGFTLMEVMIVAGIIAVISVIAISNLINMKITANEAAAKSSIRAMSTAAETTMASRGHYPASVSEFEGFLPAASNFCADTQGTKTPVQGYNYACALEVSGYTFEASPVVPGRTGNITYTATSGGILTPQ